MLIHACTYSNARIHLRLRHFRATRRSRHDRVPRPLFYACFVLIRSLFSFQPAKPDAWLASTRSSSLKRARSCFPSNNRRRLYPHLSSACSYSAYSISPEQLSFFVPLEIRERDRNRERERKIVSSKQKMVSKCREREKETEKEGERDIDANQNVAWQGGKRGRRVWKPGAEAPRCNLDPEACAEGTIPAANWVTVGGNRLNRERCGTQRGRVAQRGTIRQRRAGVCQGTESFEWEGERERDGERRRKENGEEKWVGRRGDWWRRKGGNR